MDRAIKMTMEALRAAEAKFPGWPEDPIHGAAIVAEEAGELVRASLDFYYGRHDGTDDMEKEAAQTAAVAIRFLLDLHLQSRQRREKR